MAQASEYAVEVLSIFQELRKHKNGSDFENALTKAIESCAALANMQPPNPTSATTRQGEDDELSARVRPLYYAIKMYQYSEEHVKSQLEIDALIGRVIDEARRLVPWLENNIKQTSRN
ncbi:hypothetical protein PVAG01_10682 [Phlyctema vagabunda]|uniref:Four helix bundle protein n=1 Tax=Phlyctema vagabunda TaxID=108571 RepID=A0ABR4P302_9HELO